LAPVVAVALAGGLALGACAGSGDDEADTGASVSEQATTAEETAVAGAISNDATVIEVVRLNPSCLYDPTEADQLDPPLSYGQAGAGGVGPAGGVAEPVPTPQSIHRIRERNHEKDHPRLRRCHDRRHRPGGL
jgi:hypothetical protein